MDDLLSIAVSNAVAATVLALMAIAVGAVYRRPALVHGLWLLVLLKLVTPPLLFLPISWPTVAELPPQEIVSVREEPTLAPAPVDEAREAVAIVPVADEAEPASGVASAPRETQTLGALTQPRSPVPPQPSLWPPILSIVWGVGALAWFFLALERLHRFRRLLRFARPASAALQERTRRLADSLGLKRCPCVHLLPGRIAPMLWAIGGPPRLLVPADLLELLSDEQLDTLLLHELAHLRRRDHWVRILEFVVMGLYWWHPVVWYARRELREAEEQCCDAWVVSTLPGTGRTYASALLDTLDFLSTAQAAMPPLASGLGQIDDLKRRLTMIMRGNTPRSLTWPGCLAVVALGLTFLPMLPSLHGAPPSKDEEKKLLHLQQEARKFRDEAKAVVELKKALIAKKKAEIEQAEFQLKAAEAQAREKKAEIEQAEFQLKAAEAQAREFEKQTQQRAAVRIKKVAAIRYRMEITLPSENLANPKEMIDKIVKILPQGCTIVFSGPHPAPSIVFPAPQPTPALPVRQSDEQRINDLEKKLEKVLQELHDLRKQMKGSRSEGPGVGPPSTVIIPPPAVIDPATPKSESTITPNNPYYAPTVPLNTPPADPTRP